MPQENESQACVFCLIASEKIQSYKIAETDIAIAVLELNPVSRGHTMVLPKEHLQLKEVKNKTIIFAQELAQQLKEKLDANDIEIATVDFQGHAIINLIPVYLDENIESKRYKAKKEELEEVQNLFIEKEQKVEQASQKQHEPEETIIEKADVKKTQEKEEEIKKPKEEPERTEKNMWLPRRIP